MPQMTIEQRYSFLKHINSLIFDTARFPFTEKPGNPNTKFGCSYEELVNRFQDRVKQLQTGTEWMPWVVGEYAAARTFKCAELGVHILIGFDVTLSLENGRHQRFRIIEQNPFKRDNSGNLKETAMHSRKGHALAWVIDITDRKDHKFLGKLLNGEFEANKPRATEKFTPTANGYGVVSKDVREDQHGTPFENIENDWNSLPEIDPYDFDVVGVANA